MKVLRDRVAVVTGAASGIGRALAARFAAEGMAVVLADVEPGALAEAAGALGATGARVLAVRTDVARQADVDALAAAAYDAFGAVHVLCNNAGVFVGGTVWEHAPADWEWVFGVNVFGIVHGLRSFVPRMLAGGDEGHVVNTASMAGLVAGPAAGVYQASKHAAVAISETLHHDLVLRGARVGVSVLCPGLVATNIGSCTRNRPAGAPPPPSDAAVVEDALRQSLPGGLAPAAVADLVLDAVRAGRFWVLAGPGTKDMVRVRAADVLEDRAPTFQMFA